MLHRPRINADGSRTEVLSFSEVVTDRAIKVNRQNFSLYANDAAPDVLWAVADLLVANPGLVEVRLHGTDVEWDASPAFDSEQMVKQMRTWSGASDLVTLPEQLRDSVPRRSQPQPA